MVFCNRSTNTSLICALLLLISGCFSSYREYEIKVACNKNNLNEASDIVKKIDTKSLVYKLRVVKMNSEDVKIYETEFLKDSMIYAKALTHENKVLLSNGFFNVIGVRYQQACIIHEVGHIHYRKRFLFHDVAILDLPHKFIVNFGQNAKFANQVYREFVYLTELANIYNELWADKFLLDMAPGLFIKYALQDKWIKNDNALLEKEESTTLVYCLNRTFIYSFWQNQFNTKDEEYKICSEMIVKYWTRLNEIAKHYNIDLSALEKISHEFVRILQNIDLINAEYRELSKKYCYEIFNIYEFLESRH